MSNVEKEVRNRKKNNRKRRELYKREVGILNRHLTWSELKPLLEPLRDISHPVRLSKAELVSDVRRMVDHHSSFLDTNSGCRVYLPYFDRLLRLYYICQQ